MTGSIIKGTCRSQFGFCTLIIFSMWHKMNSTKLITMVIMYTSRSAQLNTKETEGKGE